MTPSSHAPHPSAGENDDRTHVLYALAILAAVASAVGIAWLAAADLDHLGMRARCVFSLEEDGDISPCSRVRAGVRANVAAQAALATAMLVAVARRREQVTHAVAGLAASVLISGLCYVFIRSWEFGRL